RLLESSWHNTTDYSWALIFSTPGRMLAGAFFHPCADDRALPRRLAFQIAGTVGRGGIRGHALGSWLEPQVGAGGYGGGGRAGGLRDRPAALGAGRRLPRVHAAIGGDPDGGARPVRGRDRAADHRSAGAGPAQRRAVAGHHSLVLDARPVRDRPALPARHEYLRRAADGPGADDPGARAAERGQPADHDPAAGIRRPGRHDQPVIARGVAGEPVRAGPLEDPAPAHGGAGRRERGHLRPAWPAAHVRGRPLQGRVDRGKLAARGVSLTQVIETTGNALWVSPLTFVEASTPGTGGFVESPGQRLPVQHISPISTPHQLSQVPVEGSRVL